MIAPSKPIELPDHFKTLTGSVTFLQQNARKYLKKRGISKEDILKWKIGYAGSGEYSERIIFPSFDYYIAKSRI